MKSKGRSGLDLMSLNLKKKKKRRKRQWGGENGVVFGEACGSHERKGERRQRSSVIAGLGYALDVFGFLPRVPLFFFSFSSRQSLEFEAVQFTFCVGERERKHVVCRSEEVLLVHVIKSASPSCQLFRLKSAFFVLFFVCFFFTPEIFDWGILFLNN